MTINSNSPQEPQAITGRIGAAGKRIVGSLVNLLASLRVHPNILTLIGLVINIFAMVLFAKGIFVWGAIVIILAGIFDIVDGEVARRTKRVTKFGAFFDSVIDRYSDMRVVDVDRRLECRDFLTLLHQCLKQLGTCCGLCRKQPLVRGKVDRVLDATRLDQQKQKD